MASFKHPLDSVSTLLGFELHGHKVPSTLGPSCWGDASAWLTGSVGGSALEHPPWQWKESSTILHPSQLAQNRRRNGFTTNTQLCQSCLRKATLQEHLFYGRTTLTTFSWAVKALCLVPADPAGQQQCLRTIASPSTHLNPYIPASQTCARHIFKDPWTWGHQS